MAQKISGWRSVLSFPGIYRLSQNILGCSSSRYEFVKIYIRPKPSMRILDIGCGPASILKYLPEDINYVGVDLSSEYIQAAKERYGHRGQFYCLAVESIPEKFLGQFDLVMGLSVLHHLDDDQARSFFSMAAKAITQNDKGRCLTVDPCFVAGQHPIARILIRMDRGQNVRTAAEYSTLAKTAFSHVTHAIRHDRLRVPYTHHIMECRQQQELRK